MKLNKFAPPVPAPPALGLPSPEFEPSGLPESPKTLFPQFGHLGPLPTPPSLRPFEAPRAGPPQLEHMAGPETSSLSSSLLLFESCNQHYISLLIMKAKNFTNVSTTIYSYVCRMKVQSVVTTIVNIIASLLKDCYRVRSPPSPSLLTSLFCPLVSIFSVTPVNGYFL